MKILYIAFENSFFFLYVLKHAYVIILNHTRDFEKLKNNWSIARKFRGLDLGVKFLKNQIN